MKRGVDTNVLIYAHIAGAREHPRVKGFLLGQLAAQDVTLVVTPLVLHELVHVLTDPRRFPPPVSMSVAIAIARLYLGHSNVECVAADSHAVARALDLLERHGLGRKRIADTLFAATLLTNDVRELITSNPGDFTIFDAFVLIDPTAP